jgi:diaminopimelate epimerase
MIPYDKYHGTGNDFAVIDAVHHVPDRSAFAVDLCRQLDADGVLFLALEDQYTPPRVVMTLFQPDGGTADMCGNGARVAARWANERTGSDEIMLDTQAGTRHAEVDGTTVSVEMGTPIFDPAGVPYDPEADLSDVGGYEVTPVNTGVPHAVTFVDDVDAVDIETDGPAIRHHDAFPEGANATFAERVGESAFQQRTFERGVEGETLSCGTGAVAIAAVAARRGDIPEETTVTVSPPGGDLEITLTTDGNTALRGPTEYEFSDETEAVPASRVEP